jgi:spore germination protein YaaH
MKRLAWLLLLTSAAAGAQLKSLFYMTETPASIQSFLEHPSKIDILVPTWYQVDADGLVTGAPDPLVLSTAKAHHVPVMPIVALFNKAAVHTFFLNPKAHQEMIQALIRECKRNGYTGFQFDLENIAWTDRDLLSALVKETADALHAQGLQLSIATVPNAPGYPGTGGFAKWIWTDWRGAFDLKALSESVDLICLMTYDQHTRWTAPGPVGGWDWTLDNLDYALKYVPKQKLSLGIALYGYHWYAGAPKKSDDDYQPNISGEYISAPNAHLLAKTYAAKTEWDPVDHSAWFYFYRDQMREWVFFTDARTFKDRYELAQTRGLQGFCSWVLGEEDPEIWNLLPERR